MTTARDVATFLDALLESARYNDYDRALNGLQLDHRGPVRSIATAVDFSQRTVDAAVAANANMLVLHHGMFWGGAERIVGRRYARLAALLEHDIAVYASHLPLDGHAEFGNCAQLAKRLELAPETPFGTYRGTAIGWAGQCAIKTAELVERVDTFARARGGAARASAFQQSRVTRRWAVLTGAGADAEAIADAERAGIDTLIVGEGPHYTTVDAPEADLVIIYGGHYATETLGVEVLAPAIGERFGVPCRFLALPTGS
jgi:dinuclear metal center YbgI/SA1388 family protein